MRRAQVVTRVVKPAIWLGALLPLGYLALGVVPAAGVSVAWLPAIYLGADPVREMQLTTGLSVLTLLLLSLTVTPLRRLTGLAEAIRVRRLLGLFAFFYACVHLSLYVVLDQEGSLDLIVKDTAKHPWVFAGMAGFLLLLPLALTSTAGMIRRLGGRRWRALHRLVYVAALVGVLHFLWLVKKDVRLPVVYAVAFGVLMLLRAKLPARGASRAAVPNVTSG